MITKEEAAKMLDGREYPLTIGSGERGALAESRLVVVSGGSDDLMELDGVWRDEVGVWGGGEVPVGRTGVLENQCEDEDCPYFYAEKRHAKKITAIWDRDGISWQYETGIPHATFRVMEDGEVYCIGIVFSAADV